ncbi:protein adenylyltransferase Fic [Enorma phocaeensis]|uniref:protein adenylyltransferase Fic n=1 Tax=Enorma phocaeensis TaxID=1871019 RepID=UPI003D18F28F
MTLENKLGIEGDVELAREEERLTKKRALELFENGLLDTFEVGTFAGLSKIHGYLFQDVYDFAGELRTVNIAKSNFRFASVMYLSAALDAIDGMPRRTFDQIVEKYVEMNVAHPFREGNGRSTRIWLDANLKRELGVVVDWSRVDREDYLLAMERSPVRDTEIKAILKDALTDAVDDRQVYMKGIDASYRYEGYSTYTMDELASELGGDGEGVGSGRMDDAPISSGCRGNADE